MVLQHMCVLHTCRHWHHTQAHAHKTSSTASATAASSCSPAPSCCAPLVLTADCCIVPFIASDGIVCITLMLAAFMLDVPLALPMFAAPFTPAALLTIAAPLGGGGGGRGGLLITVGTTFMGELVSWSHFFQFVMALHVRACDTRLRAFSGLLYRKASTPWSWMVHLRAESRQVQWDTALQASGVSRSHEAL
jgi:hypothetical protein